MMEGEKGYGERSPERESPIGPTCFGFEEVQPAKLSLRDVESSWFFSLSFITFLSFPLFFHHSLYISICPSILLVSPPCS